MGRGVSECSVNGGDSLVGVSNFSIILRNLSLQRTNHVPLSYETAPLYLLISDVASTTVVSLKR